jgi:hypothetical protein
MPQVSYHLTTQRSPTSCAQVAHAILSTDLPRGSVRPTGFGLWRLGGSLQCSMYRRLMQEESESENIDKGGPVDELSHTMVRI